MPWPGRPSGNCDRTSQGGHPRRNRTPTGQGRADLERRPRARARAGGATSPDLAQLRQTTNCPWPGRRSPGRNRTLAGPARADLEGRPRARARARRATSPARAGSSAGRFTPSGQLPPTTGRVRAEPWPGGPSGNCDRTSQGGHPRRNRTPTGQGRADLERRPRARARAGGATSPDRAQLRQTTNCPWPGRRSPGRNGTLAGQARADLKGQPRARARARRATNPAGGQLRLATNCPWPGRGEPTLRAGPGHGSEGNRCWRGAAGPGERLAAVGGSRRGPRRGGRGRAAAPTPGRRHTGKPSRAGRPGQGQTQPRAHQAGG